MIVAQRSFKGVNLNRFELDVKVRFSRSRILFSQTSEYALRSVAHLAVQPNFADTIPRISIAISVNAPYLRKVLNQLRDAGIVNTQRGAGGGITLAIDPNALTILDVLDAVDPIDRVEKCPLGLPDHFRLCPLHAELDDAIAQIKSVLGRRSIGELLAQTAGKPARCDFPRQKTIYEL